MEIGSDPAVYGDTNDALYYEIQKYGLFWILKSSLGVTLFWDEGRVRRISNFDRFFLQNFS